MSIYPYEDNFVFDEAIIKYALEARKNFKLLSFQKKEIEEDESSFIFQKYEV